MRAVRVNIYYSPFTNSLHGVGEYDHDGLVISVSFSEDVVKEILEIARADAESKIPDILKSLNEELGIEHG